MYEVIFETLTFSLYLLKVSSGAAGVEGTEALVEACNYSWSINVETYTVRCNQLIKAARQ